MGKVYRADRKSVQRIDQEDDKGFNKGSDGLFTFLEPGQHLESRGRENNR